MWKIGRILLVVARTIAYIFAFFLIALSSDRWGTFLVTKVSGHRFEKFIRGDPPLIWIGGLTAMASIVVLVIAAKFFRIRGKLQRLLLFLAFAVMSLVAAKITESL